MSPVEILDLAGPDDYSIHQAVAVAGCVYRKKLNNIMLFGGISGKLKNILNNASVSGLFRPVKQEVSDDASVKYLFMNNDGQKYETVYLPDKRRHTVCVSSQSGCRMGCPYCVTGRYGFHGDLTAGEIINQVLSLPFVSGINHVVFMGMGEPLDNLSNVLKACSIMTAEWGLALSPRNVTVSTVGITPGVIKFLNESDCNLALSLYSPFPEERIMMVPAERKYPSEEIINIMKDFPLKNKRRLSIAYMMMAGINDTDSHLEGLKSLFSGSKIRINLLPYHSARGDTGNITSGPERMQHFRHELVMSGISASIRKSRGEDISAACGLLASGLE